jgi:hypothetical protein
MRRWSTLEHQSGSGLRRSGPRTTEIRSTSGLESNVCGHTRTGRRQRVPSASEWLRLAPPTRRGWTPALLVDDGRALAAKALAAGVATELLLGQDILRAYPAFGRSPPAEEAWQGAVAKISLRRILLCWRGRSGIGGSLQLDVWGRCSERGIQVPAPRGASDRFGA